MVDKVKIRCGDSDCTKNLHCYQEARKIASRKTKRASGDVGGAAVSSEMQTRRVCRDCGAALVDWDRVGQRKPGDVEYTIRSLKTELIRHHYWKHAKLGPRAVNYARRKGRVGMRAAVRHHLSKTIGTAHPFRDGYQTPYGEEDVGPNILYFAQHATASCCRKCAELWHQVTQKTDLSEEALSYLTELCMIYILDRIPDLAEEGGRVPAMPRDKSN